MSLDSPNLSWIRIWENKNNRYLSIDSIFNGALSSALAWQPAKLVSVCLLHLKNVDNKALYIPIMFMYITSRVDYPEAVTSTGAWGSTASSGLGRGRWGMGWILLRTNTGVSSFSSSGSGSGASSDGSWSEEVKNVNHYLSIYSMCWKNSVHYTVVEEEVQ